MPARGPDVALLLTLSGNFLNFVCDFVEINSIRVRSLYVDNEIYK